MDRRIIERNVENLKTNQESPVEFKNLTKSPVKLFWIDFDDDKHNFYAQLEPIGRKDRGLRVKIYNSHPWLAKINGTNNNVLLNGRKYFNPPRPNIGMKRWMNERWNQVSKENHGIIENEEDSENHEENYFEVLILETGK
jgi:von Hippel-Lindau disease tumour suppressor protein.